jgi:hypothetical protein
MLFLTISGGLDETSSITNISFPDTLLYGIVDPELHGRRRHKQGQGGIESEAP